MARAIGLYPIRWLEPTIACAERVPDQPESVDEWCILLDRIEDALALVRRQAPACGSTVTA